MVFDPSLLLSPHVLLLANLIRYNACKSPELERNPALLGSEGSRSNRGENELALGFHKDHKDMRDKLIFRRALQQGLRKAL